MKPFLRYIVPCEDDIVAIYTHAPEALSYLKEGDMEKSFAYYAPRIIADEICNHLSFFKYYKSEITGKIYDYIPAIDPVCSLVLEARFEGVSNAMKKVKELESIVASQSEKIKDLELTITGMEKRGYVK